MPRCETAVGVIGLFFVGLGLLFNEWVLVLLFEDGRLDDRAALILLRLFDASIILAGGLILVFRKRAVTRYWLAAVSIALVSLLFFDGCLYLLAPVLPERLVSWMSPQARMRRWRVNPESGRWIVEGGIRLARPHTEIYEYGFSVEPDSLGYRNPRDALGTEGVADVVLLGDSFTWGTERQTIADFLRKELAPRRVYSLGIGGEGIPQWREHYERFHSLNPGAAKTALVIMNFYSGNDITDTKLYRRLRREDGTVDAREYFAFLYDQYLLEPWISWAPKLPEVFFLARAAIARHEWRRPVSYRDLAGLSLPVCMHHREPSPEELSEEILSELRATVAAVRKASPSSRVLLSYIPTSGGIYGDLMDQCPDYRNDVPKQRASSGVLARFSTTAGVSYVDLTPDLRSVARQRVLWSEDDHFSLDGYRVYASLLADRIKSKRW